MQADLSVRVANMSKVCFLQIVKRDTQVCFVIYSLSSHSADNGFVCLYWFLVMCRVNYHV